jgi:sialate O-acetylesterase
MRSFILAFILSMVVGLQPAAATKLHRLFSDHMVLQREVPVPVWGTATPGEIVRVEIAGQSATAVAGPDGHWKAMLPALKAGGPHRLVVSGSEEIVLEDVMVGEVWLASGQSNMQWPLHLSDNAAAEMAAARHHDFRFFRVEQRPAQSPKSGLENGNWEPLTPESARNFSAVAYYFGRRLKEELNVPVGIIACYWGGTVAEAWTSREMLLTLPEYRDVLLAPGQDAPGWEADIEANNERQRLKNELIAQSNNGLRLGVHKLNYIDTDWPVAELPGQKPDWDGILWLRKVVNLPKDVRGQGLRLDLGRLENYAVVYFNGEKLGETSSPNYAVFDIPGSLVKAGQNLIAVRLLHRWGKPDWTGPAGRMKLTSQSGAVLADLNDVWFYKTGLEPEFPEVKSYQNYPTALYNGMVAPVIPYALRGVIWYQGESNVSRAAAYRSLFATMIQDWRVRWGLGYFPFLYVQLANYLDRNDEPVESDWAELREAQLLTLQQPNTGMAVIIDIGEALDIHPRNKSDVGNRLALAALNRTYGMEMEYSGPLFRSMEIKGAEVELAFDHAEGGLTAKGGELRGFSVAGEDRRFYWAKAIIAGSKVVLRCEKVPKPVAVRYGWSANPDCNLYNRAGLPASPFRTDTWPGMTGR